MDTALASEKALARDWLSKDDEKAWKDLKKMKDGKSAGKKSVNDLKMLDNLTKGSKLTSEDVDEISRKVDKAAFKRLAKYFQDEFKKKGITQKDVDDAVRWARNQCPKCASALRKAEVKVAGAKSKAMSYQCPKCDYFKFEPLSSLKVVKELRK